MENIEDQVRRILLLEYPEKIVEKRLKTHLKISGRMFSIAKCLLRMSEEEVIQKFRRKVKLDQRKGTLERYIEKFGEDLGTKKYKEKNSRLSVSEKSLRLNGKSEEEIKKIRNTHSKKSAITKENLMRVHGNDQGEDLYKSWMEKSRERSCWCIEFWIDKGLTKEEAKLKISDIQRFDFEHFEEKGWSIEDYHDFNLRKTFALSKEGYTERFGEIEGPLRFAIDKRKGTDIDHFISKFGEVEGRRKYLDTLEKRTALPASTNSKIQKDFCMKLYESLDEPYKSSFLGSPISEKGGWIGFPKNEFGLRCSLPDILINNVIIEFDGDFWHSSAKVITRDNQKDILFHQLGYSVLRIKEGLYKKEPKLQVDLALAFIRQHFNTIDLRKNNEN